MRTISIAFDVDGTLVSETTDNEGRPIINERIRNLLIALSQLENVEIIVWSGGGPGYAQHVASRICINKYVDTYAGKDRTIKPDIAIDDIQDCDLGDTNLIV